MNKQTRRKEFKDQLASLDGRALNSGWQALEETVVSFCLKRLSLQKGSVVTLFGGLPDEVDLVPSAMKRLQQGGLRAALFGLHEQPRTARVGGQMDAYLIENMDHIRRGKFGIWEPDMTRAALVGPEDLAVVLVPGLIFSEPNGARLGRGGGYFDRYLARTPKTTLRVGVALDWQLVADLPTETHDQGMNWLVTDKRVIRCSSD